MKPIFLFAIVLHFAFCHGASAASTRVEWHNAPGTELGDFLGNPLKTGTPADYDGARLQLGYYSLATLADPFAGDWMPLTGLEGDLFPTSIGDKGNLGRGLFGLSSSFDAASTLSLPTNNMPLSIRFYDSADPTASAFFNAVSNDAGAWNWLTPSDPQSVINISLSDAGLIWQGGPGSAFRTTINNVPEPASWAWLLMGGFLVWMSRRAIGGATIRTPHPRA